MSSELLLEEKRKPAEIIAAMPERIKTFKDSTLIRFTPAEIGLDEAVFPDVPINFRTTAGNWPSIPKSMEEGDPDYEETLAQVLTKRQSILRHIVYGVEVYLRHEGIIEPKNSANSSS